MFCTEPVNVASGSFGMIVPGVEGILARPPGMGRPTCENAGNPKASKSIMDSTNLRGAPFMTFPSKRRSQGHEM
jgi:hypothetical protein